MVDFEYQGDATSTFNSNYDMFFRIICSETRHLNIGAKASINKDKKYIADLVGVLLIAEEHGAVTAVADFLQRNLIPMGQRLWQYVSADPALWLGIAARLEASVIFKEAMCHAVGKIDAKQFISRNHFENKGPLYSNILKLIDKKVYALLELKQSVEWELTGFWPLRMYHPAEGGFVPDRGVYTSDIYLYQSRSLVMQYISGCYAKGYNSLAPDGGIRFYQTIRHGGEAYCNVDQQDTFRARFPMSTRALEPFNQAMEVMKKEIKACLDAIMVDNSQGNVNKDARLGYLTCTFTAEDELPWKIPLENDDDHFSNY